MKMVITIYPFPPRPVGGGVAPAGHDVVPEGAAPHPAGGHPEQARHAPLGEHQQAAGAHLMEGLPRAGRQRSVHIGNQTLFFSLYLCL